MCNQGMSNKKRNAYPREYMFWIPEPGIEYATHYKNTGNWYERNIIHVKIIVKRRGAEGISLAKYQVYIEISINGKYPVPIQPMVKYRAQPYNKDTWYSY